MQKMLKKKWQFVMGYESYTEVFLVMWMEHD